MILIYFTSSSFFLFLFYFLVSFIKATLLSNRGKIELVEDIFKEEDQFYCTICGKKLEKTDEIEEEICQDCLSSFLLNAGKKKLDVKKS